MKIPTWWTQFLAWWAAYKFPRLQRGAPTWWLRFRGKMTTRFPRLRLFFYGPRWGWKARDRMRRFATWIDKSRWPFVLKKRLRAEQATRADALRQAQNRYATDLAKLRADIAPVIDKLIRIRPDVQQYVLEIDRDAPMQFYAGDAIPFDQPRTIPQKLIDARYKYQLVMEMAPDLIEHALIHGNSDVFIKEIALRAAHEIERELKTINFARLRAESRERRRA